MFGLFQQLAEDSNSWSKACVALSVPLCCDKLGDIKLKKPAGDAMGVFAEKSSLGFVLSQGTPSSLRPIHSRRMADKTLTSTYSIRFDV